MSADVATGLGLALIAGAVYRFAEAVRLLAARPLPDPKAWADHVADALYTQAPRAIDAWWNQARYVAPPVSAVATPTSAGEQDEAVAQAVAYGVDELRAAYAAKGVTRTPEELQAEAFDLLRQTMDVPDDY